MTSETFEQVLTAAQADGAFTPAWKKFVNTKFFVPVVRGAGADPGHFALDVADEGGQSIQISEVRERLGQRDAGTLATLSGADVVRMLGADGGILIALSDRAFRIARERVEWLKKGIEASQAKAAAKVLDAAGRAPVADTASQTAVQGAPRPAPVSMVKAEPTLAPVAPSPARKQGGVLDVAALKPRSVGLPRLGLDFFVPGAWREIQNNKGLQFVDNDSGTVLKASGLHRPDVSLAKWQATSMALVEHDMRYLTQDGAPYVIDGDDWRDRVKGMATEFTGIFPGDDAPSRYLVACVRIEGTVASITIRAPAEQFEQNRALYKWLLGRIDLNEMAAVEHQRTTSGAASAGRQHDDLGKPGVFGISLTGRITRLQALAYSFPIWLPFVGVAVLAAMVAPKNWTLALVMGVSSLVVALWLSLRLLVLRLHDANISGKWILYFIGVAILAAVIRNPTLLALVVIGGWLLSMVFYGVVPGTADDNDYGPQPDENSNLVKIGAGLFILLNLMSILGQGKMMSTPGYQNPLSFGGARGGAAESEMVTFEPDDGSFMVDMPGTPELVPMPADMQNNMGGSQSRIYQLSTDQGVYQAQTIFVGSGAIDHNGVMDTLQSSVIGRGGVLLGSSTIILNGFKGREVRARMPNGLQRSARYVIVGTKIRMVMIMANDDPSGQARVDAFLSSFRLA